MIQPLRFIFKAGGTIRDEQVQVDLVEKFETEHSRSFPLMKEFYRSRISDQRDEFFVKSLEMEQADVSGI